MTKEEMIKNVEQDIMYRKDFIKMYLEQGIKDLQKQLDEFEKLENACDVINYSRAVSSITYDLNSRVSQSEKSIDELRQGLYWLNCVSEAEKK